MKRLISVVVLAAGIALGSNAMAADWNFYGNARIETFWSDVDDGSDSSETNFSESLQGNSRIGAKVKVSDELVGRFEYGASDGNANIRHLYGEWDFGGGKLLVGQTDSLVKFSLSNQVYNCDEALDHYGHVNANRRPLIRLTFGNFQIAAISPEDGNDVDGDGEADDERFVMPKLEAKYKLSKHNFTIEAAAGYQTYEVTFGTDEFDVDSYVLAIGGKFNFGPAYIGADGYLGQNVGPYGLKIKAEADPVVNSGELEDNDAYGLMGLVGCKMNDTLALEAGIGYVSAELDNDASDEDDAMAYYVQATVTLAKGVFIVPEIGALDYLDDADGVDEGDEYYWGMKWQINF